MIGYHWARKKYFVVMGSAVSRGWINHKMPQKIYDSHLVQLSIVLSIMRCIMPVLVG